MLQSLQFTTKTLRALSLTKGCFKFRPLLVKLSALSILVVSRILFLD